MDGAPDLASHVAWQLAGAVDDADLDAVVTDALRDLAQFADADRAYITLYHDDGTFQNSHEWTPGDVVPQMPVIQRLRADEFPYSYDLALHNEVWNVPDLSTESEVAAAEFRSFSAFGVRAVLQVPIIAKGEGIGLVGLNNFHVRSSWSDEIVDRARGIGQALGIAVRRQRTEAALRRAYERAERANRSKAELLAHVSHELRTPLHAILGYAELLDLDCETERERDSLFNIQFHGRHLLAMVEDLLATSAVEHEPVAHSPIQALLDPAVRALEQVAAHREVTIELGGGLAIEVDTNPGRMRQVLYCVLSGALQAVTRDGRVEVNAEETTGDKTAVAISVVSSQPLHGSAMIKPLADALIEGYGSILIDTEGEQRATVTVTIDRSE